MLPHTRGDDGRLFSFVPAFLGRTPRAIERHRERMEDTAASTGTVTTGPATFAEAFAAEDSSASTTAVDTAQTDSASAGTTDQPAEQAATDAQPQQQGEPPRERWDAILSNAREKAAAEARAQMESELGWAKGVDRQQIEQAVRIAQLYQQDRTAFVRELMGDNPPPELVSEFARQLAGRRGQQPPQADAPPPTVSVQLEDGSVVQMPRDPQQWLAWHQQQWMRQVEQQMAPFKQTHEQIQALQQHAKATAEAQKFAQDFGGGELAKLPHFSELKAEIKERLAQTQLASDHPAEVKAAAYRIYTAVLAEKVLPNLTQKAQTKLLDNLQQKAAASSGVNPAGAASSAQKPVTSFHQLGPDAWK